MLKAPFRQLRTSFLTVADMLTRLRFMHLHDCFPCTLTNTFDSSCRQHSTKCHEYSRLNLSNTFDSSCRIHSIDSVDCYKWKDAMCLQRRVDSLSPNRRKRSLSVKNTSFGPCLKGVGKDGEIIRQRGWNKVAGRCQNRYHIKIALATSNCNKGNFYMMNGSFTIPTSARWPWAARLCAPRC